MPIVKDFIDAAKSFALSAVNTNRENRAEICKVVITLSDELDRALSLIIIYLEGARNIDDDDKLEDFLHNMRGKLLDTCNEFHVCGALYDLSDRFSQLFDSIKGSVSIGKTDEIERLLWSLKDRERSILDGISKALEQIESVSRRTKGRSERFEAINKALSELRKQRDDVKKVARDIVDTI